MLYVPETQPVATRFSIQIEEFRTVARMHDLPSGTPETLVALPLRLAKDWRLRSSFVEMIRALQARDPEFSLPDALSLLTVAVGGPNATQRNPELDEPINLVAGFLASIGGWPGSETEPITDLDNPPDHDPRLDLAAPYAASSSQRDTPSAAQASGGPFTLPGEPPPSVTEALSADQETSAEARGSTGPTATGLQPDPVTFGNVSADPTPAAPVPLSRITEALARLERGNLELRLHLDSIDQRISRMEPLLESTPHAAEIADLRSEAQLLRELAPDALHLVPHAASSSHIPEPPVPQDTASSLPAEDMLQQLPDFLRQPAGPSSRDGGPRDLVHRGSPAPIIPPAPTPAPHPLNGRLLLRAEPVDTSPVAPSPLPSAVLPPVADSHSAYTHTTEDRSVPAHPSPEHLPLMPSSPEAPLPQRKGLTPRRDRFAAARELPGFVGGFDQPFRPSDEVSPSAASSPQEPGSPEPERPASQAPLPSPIASPPAASEPAASATPIAAPAPEPVTVPLPDSEPSSMQAETHPASAPLLDAARLAPSSTPRPQYPANSALFQTGPHQADEDDSPKRKAAAGPIAVGVAAVLLVGISAFLLLRGTPLPFLMSTAPASTTTWSAPSSATSSLSGSALDHPSETGSRPERASGAREASTPSASSQVTAAPTFVPEATMDGLLLAAPRPAYPTLAGLVGLRGRVIFEAMVSKSGDVEALRVLGGPHLLRDAASDAVRQWKYKPFLVKGRPVEVRTIIRVDVAPHVQPEPAAQ